MQRLVVLRSSFFFFFFSPLFLCRKYILCPCEAWLTESIIRLGCQTRQGLIWKVMALISINHFLV